MATSRFDLRDLWIAILRGGHSYLGQVMAAGRSTRALEAPVITFALLQHFPKGTLPPQKHRLSLQMSAGISFLGKYCETFNTYNRLRIKLTCLLILLLDPESNLKLPFGKLKAISVSLSTLHDPDPIRLYILYQLPQAFPQSVPSVCRGLHHTAGNVPIAPQWLDLNTGGAGGVIGTSYLWLSAFHIFHD